MQAKKHHRKQLQKESWTSTEIFRFQQLQCRFNCLLAQQSYICGGCEDKYSLDINRKLKTIVSMEKLRIYTSNTHQKDFSYEQISMILMMQNLNTAI